MAMEVTFSDLDFRYTSYPYGDPDQKGIYMIQTSEYLAANPLALQTQGYYHRVDKDIDAYTLSTKLRLPSSFNFDISYTRYREEIDPDSLDQLGLFNLHWNMGGMVSDTNALWDIGTGLTLLNYDDTSHATLSLATSFDYFPEKPLGIHVSALYAPLVSREITVLEAQTGYYLKSWELLAGYRFLLNSDGENFNGPFMGLALWF